MAQKSATVTFLGDEDPAVQSVEMFGRTFVKGQPVTMKGSDSGFSKITNNPTFSTEKHPEVVESDEPEPPNPEAGTEIEALKRELDSRGVKYRANSSEEALRKALAQATAE